MAAMLRYGAALVIVNAALLLLNPANAAEIRLLALGDSLTAGLGLPATEGFVPQLEAALRAKGHDVRVLNAGVSGDTTAGGLRRLDWALGGKPQATIVALGANDMLRGLAPEQAQSNLDAILGKLKQHDVKVLLAGMRTIANWGPDYTQKFEAIYPALAKKHSVAFYPFFLDGVAGNAALNQPDGLHPNWQGVAAMVKSILPEVERLLAGVQAAG